MFRTYRHIPGLSFEKSFDSMMEIVSHFNLQKTAPLLYQDKVLRVEMIRSEDKYILQIDKCVTMNDSATDKIIWDLTFRRLVKEMFEVEIYKSKMR